MLTRIENAAISGRQDSKLERVRSMATVRITKISDRRLGRLEVSSDGILRTARSPKNVNAYDTL
jgi:hypothetical protein